MKGSPRDGDRQGIGEATTNSRLAKSLLFWTALIVAAVVAFRLLS